MLLVELTLPLPAENVALDEALLAACEAGEITGDVLRLWEPSDYFVVLGRSSDPAVEVNLTTCRAQRVPVLRRVSGGGTILAGPGCLMYAAVIHRQSPLNLTTISHAHQYVLDRIAASLRPLVPGITLAGTSDLAFPDDGRALQKFSGNALRLKRTHLLYHGTLMYDFDLERVGQLLAQQTREPLYRAERSHRDFIANLPIAREKLVAALEQGWQAVKKLQQWPEKRMQHIVREKYVDDPQWVIT